MTNESSTTRDAELRRLLVAQASARPPRRRVATVTAAALGSLAVVGALAAVTVFAANPSLVPSIGQGGNEEYEFGTPSFVYADATILGEPVQFRSGESQVVDLGEAPPGATALGMRMRCFAEGTYSVASLDGLAPFVQPLSCDDDAQVTPGGLGTYIPYSLSGPTRVEITATPGGEYAIWLAWVAKPADPVPSAAQAEALVDGVVTREEYVAGFDRYAACMSAGGYSIGGNRETEIIQYSVSSDAVSSGTDDRCYGTEFKQLDIEWQIAHPQSSLDQQLAFADGVVTRDEYLAGFDRYAACMAQLGATVSVDDRQAAVLSYDVDASPELSGEAGRCYRFEFFQIETTWKASADD